MPPTEISHPDTHPPSISPTAGSPTNKGGRPSRKTDPPPAVPRFTLDSIPTAVWTVISLALVVVIWQLVVSFGHVSPLSLPAPYDVLVSIGQNSSALLTNGLVTLREIVIGFVLAVAIGIPIAMGIAFSKIFAKLAYPLLVVTQSVPKVAIAPLFLIWFGFGAVTNAVLAMLVAVFPVVLNTALGLTSLEPDYVRLARVMNGSSWRVFRYVRVPAALPSTFAGLKLAMTLATIGAVVGEFTAGQAGLGYLAQVAAGQLNTELTFASVVVLSVLGIILFYLIVAVERLVIGWHQTIDER